MFNRKFNSQVRDVVEVSGDNLCVHFIATGITQKFSVIPVRVTGLSFVLDGTRVLVRSAVDTAESVLVEEFANSAAAKSGYDLLVRTLREGLRPKVWRWFVRGAAAVAVFVLLGVGSLALLLSSVRGGGVSPSSPQAQTARPAEIMPVAELLVAAGFAAGEKPTDFAVRMGKGNRTLFVFADPKCPSCQQLEPILEQASKQFKIELMPVAFQPGSAPLVRAVLCAKNREEAWKRAIAGKLVPIDVACPAASGMEKLMALHRLQRHSGTPAIVSDRGETTDRFASYDDLLTFMAR